MTNANNNYDGDDILDILDSLKDVSWAAPTLSKMKPKSTSIDWNELAKKVSLPKPAPLFPFEVPIKKKKSKTTKPSPSAFSTVKRSCNVPCFLTDDDITFHHSLFRVTRRLVPCRREPIVISGKVSLVEALPDRKGNTFVVSIPVAKCFSQYVRGLHSFSSSNIVSPMDMAVVLSKSNKEGFETGPLGFEPYFNLRLFYAKREVMVSWDGFKTTGESKKNNDASCYAILEQESYLFGVPVRDTPNVVSNLIYLTPSSWMERANEFKVSTGVKAWKVLNRAQNAMDLVVHEGSHTVIYRLPILLLRLHEIEKKNKSLVDQALDHDIFDGIFDITDI